MKIRYRGLVLVISSIGIGFVAGIAAFLGTAALTSTVTALAIGGGIASFFVTALLARSGFRKLGHARPGYIAAGFAGVCLLLTGGLAGASIFRPVRAISLPSTDESQTQFWDLSTGSRIAYRHVAHAGPGEPTPVIFLHGGPGTPDDGVPMGGPELAAAGFDIYAYDQLGAGRSQRLADVTGYTVARHVADLEAIRKIIGAEQITLIGESWGASLAAQYLAVHPNRVERVAFISPGALWEGAYRGGSIGDPIAGLPAPVRNKVDAMLSTPRMLAVALLLEINPNAAHALVGDREADLILHEAALTGREATTCQGSPAPAVHNNRQGFYVNQVTSADFDAAPDLRPSLRRISVPALVMRGECDFIEWEVALEYRQTLPNARLIYVPEAGHGISHSRPALYTSLLKAFVLDERLPLAPYDSDQPPPRGLK